MIFDKYIHYNTQIQTNQTNKNMVNMHYINMLKYGYYIIMAKLIKLAKKNQKCKLIIIITYIHYKIEHICKKITHKKQDFLTYAFHQTPYVHSKLGA